MLRKIAAVFAAILLVMTSMALPVNAVDPAKVTLTQTSFADVGETFNVSIGLSDNPGVRSLSLTVRYSFSDVSLEGVTDGGLIGGFYSTPIGSNTVQLVWTGSGSDVSDNGTLATLTFKVLQIPENGSMIYLNAIAHSGNGVSITVDGDTSLLYFGSALNQTVPDPAADPNAPAENPETESVEGDVSEAENVVEDVSEDPTPLETEPPETEAPPTTTTVTTRRPATTTTHTTPRPETTPEPTTEAPPTTTEPTTEETLPETTPEMTTEAMPETMPEITTEEMHYYTEGETQAPVFFTTKDERNFSEVYNDGVNNKSANRGTMLLALIALALTGVVVVAIEIYRRKE